MNPSYEYQYLLNEDINFLQDTFLTTSKFMTDK